MTGRATYGDFAAAIRRHLNALPRPVAGPGRGPGPDTTIVGVTAAIRSAVRVMARYTDDIQAVFAAIPPNQRTGLVHWMKAAREAGNALANAAALLEPGPGEPGADPVVSNAQMPGLRRIEAATMSMSAARDLLHTHLDPQPGQHKAGRSEWAPVITSVPVSCVLLSQTGWWASQIAQHGEQAAVTSIGGTTQDRRNLNEACQWLWVMTWAIGKAHEHQPVSPAQRRLLDAIPVNEVPPRHLPAGSEPVTALCDGVIAAAERLRASARLAAARARWAPTLTRESLRHTAGTCAITASNCGIVLSTLTGHHWLSGPATDAVISEARQSTEKARAAWLAATAAWDFLSIDIIKGTSQTAIDAADLALWTGRLAYADPDWTPRLGPGHPARPASDLALGPADLDNVIDAVHHGCHTLAAVAAAEHSQVITAMQAGRLLVPTRNLPASSRVPYLFAHASPTLAQPLIAAYWDTAAASGEALSAVARVADRAGTPSRVLTTARTVAVPSQAAAPGRRGLPAASPPRPAQPVPPGPVERILIDLDITSPADLEEAGAIDKAASQLIFRAATAASQLPPGRPRALGRSVGTIEMLNDLHAAGGDVTLAALGPQWASGRPLPRRPRHSVVRTALPAALTAPRQARSYVRRTLSSWGLEGLADDAELLVSELVANAAEHGDGKPIYLALHKQTRTGGAPGIRCEITDTSSRLPRPRNAADCERGRGLALVAAVAAESGLRASKGSKTAWFTLTTQPEPSRNTDRHAERELEAGA